MATLHVRNVPDGLYETLRDQADRDGRSIGAQALVLLRQALSQRQAFLGSRRTTYRRRSPFLERFAESAKEVVLRAQEHARALGAMEVTPGHVLLAMLDDPLLREPLERGGIDEEAVRGRLPRGPGSPTPVPLSDETRALLEQAFRSSFAPPVGVDFDALTARLTAREAPEGRYLAVTLEGDWTGQLNALAEDGWELFSVTPVGAEVRAVLRRL